MRFTVKHLNIKGKILLSILGSISAILLIIMFAYYYFFKNFAIRQIQENAMSSIHLAVSEYEGFLNEKAKIAWFMANNAEVIDWLSQNSVRDSRLLNDRTYQRILADLKMSVRKDQDINSAFIASEKARFYWDDKDIIRDPATYFVDRRPWYINVKEQGKPVWDVTVGYTEKKVLLNYRNPVFGDNGDFLGVTGIDFELADVERFFNSLNTFQTAKTYLINRDGLVLFDEDNEHVLKANLNDFSDENSTYRQIKPVADDIAAGAANIRQVIYEGEKRYFMYAPFESVEWALLLSVDDAEINRPLTRLGGTFFMIVIGALVLLAVIISLISSSIARPIENIVEMVDDVAQGERNLTKRLAIKSDDEIGRLAASFNTFVDKLHSVMVHVHDNSHLLAEATTELSAGTKQMAVASEEQKHQTGMIAASIEQMTAAIYENAKTAGATAEVTEAASKKAEEGAMAIEQTQTEMDEIIVASYNTETIIESLSKKANEIISIVQVIDEVAGQTNLIALNAAIESSRAGEQGKGFSVVAEEVRKLAKVTSEATKNVSDTIRSIQADIKAASDAMQSTSKAVQQGKTVTDNTEKIFDEIIHYVKDATGKVNEIAAATEQMSNGAREISSSLKNMRDVAEESASSTESMAANIQELSEQTENLDKLINQFTL
ncbi:methyl-accepting chemotaxis protein [bacterium]|nr:methyl-accepting chemotaxis protein [bacterium]